MLGTDVDEMNVQPVNLGREVRQGVQFRLTGAPVVLGPPVACELLYQLEPHALRVVGDRLAVSPRRCREPPTQIGDFLFWKFDTERPDFSFAGHKSCSLSRMS